MKQILGLIAFVGAVLAALSLYEHELMAKGLQTAGSFCNINEIFNCDKINQSEYSRFLGLPVAAYGLGFYLSLIAVLFYFSIESSLSIFAFAGMVASILSLILFYISKTQIGTLCILCIGMYIVNFLLFVIPLKKSPQSLSSHISNACDALQKKISFAVLVLFIFIFSFAWPSLILFSKEKQNSTNTEYDNSPAYKFNLDEKSNALSRDYSEGPANAQITLIEFSDFECPACRNAFPMVEELISKYKDKIKFVPKSYPLDIKCNPNMQVEGHKHGCFTAELVRCAGEQEKFWEAYRYVFSTEAFNGSLSPEGVTRSLWSGIGTLGIDVGAVDECIKSKRQLKKIQSDIQEGARVEIKGTPSFFINGRAVNHTELKATIEKLANG